MSIFKNNKQTKLTTTLIQDLNWMVKRVSVDTLPEYQQDSDTLRFRDNFKNAADKFREQHTKDKDNIITQMYTITIDRQKIIEFYKREYFQGHPILITYLG